MSSDAQNRRTSSLHSKKSRSPYAEYGSRDFSRAPRIASDPARQSVPKASAATFKRTVLTYWKRAGRHTLPWRKTRDPYKIMVSEIMLQQTQVDRVIPYYRAFLKRFPTIQDLAAAPLIEVLKLWSGLGYNRRAKMLHEAAKAVVAHHGGVMPRARETLESLPGVGPYTAGAIRAFAYNQPEVFIETNIRAALIHHFFPTSSKVDDKLLIPILESLSKSDLHKQKTKKRDVKVSAREWYAALMDYGAYLKSITPNPSRKSKHHVRQSKFEGSLRQVRGALLKAATRGDALDGVQQKYPTLFETALEALKNEGLIS